MQEHNAIAPFQAKRADDWRVANVERAGSNQGAPKASEWMIELNG